MLQYKANKRAWGESKQTRARDRRAAVKSASEALTSAAGTALGRLVASLGAHRVPQGSLDALRKHWPDLPSRLSGAGEDEASVRRNLGWLLSTLVR